MIDQQIEIATGFSTIQIDEIAILTISLVIHVGLA